jgi:hypothetical protein
MEEAAKVIREQSLFGLTASEANERVPALVEVTRTVLLE